MQNRIAKLYATKARLIAQLQDPELRQDLKLCGRLCAQLEEVEHQIDQANLLMAQQQA
jgi:hypothetical protein